MTKRLFRTCRNMRYKSGTVPPGTLVWLDKPDETMKRLLNFGVITSVRMPPMEAFPGWEERGPRLEIEGVKDAEDFLMRPPKELAELLRESPETIEAWQRQVMMWLSGQPTAE